MNTELLTTSHGTFKVRPEFSDASYIKEIFEDRTYKKLTINEDDVVLDAGANIGVFAVWACRQGAKHVVSFEPEQDNYDLALANIELNGYQDRVTLIRAALVGNDESHRDLSVNVRKNKGYHSLIQKRGRDTVTVPAVSFNEVVRIYQPTVWKLDIEGAEVECLRSLESFQSCRELIMEFHTNVLNDGKNGHVLYSEIIDGIVRPNFDINAKRAEELGTPWAPVIYGVRS